MNKPKTPPAQFEEVDVEQYAVAKPRAGRAPTFVLEMRHRAERDGLLPHELLRWIASDPEAEFIDYLFKNGELVEVTRKATLKERIDCAKHSAQYFASPKAQQINQNNTIRIEHALPQTELDSTVLDALGSVIETDDISLDE